MGKDLLHEFLVTVEQSGATKGKLRGLLHILVGRRVTQKGGALVSSGLSWRVLAAELKRVALASSSLMSFSDSCGRSTLIFSLFSLAVNLNGGW